MMLAKELAALEERLYVDVEDVLGPLSIPPPNSAWMESLTTSSSWGGRRLRAPALSPQAPSTGYEKIQDRRLHPGNGLPNSARH